MKQAGDDARVRASLWTGQSFAKPVDTPGVMSGGPGGGLLLWSANEDTLRCVYAGRLQPAEDYAVGGHGWSTLKPFCMELSKGVWGKPSAMAPRNRWAYGDLSIFGRGREKHFLASAQYADRLWIRRSKLEHRILLDDGKWSKPDRVVDSAGDVSSPSGAIDSADTVHVVYDVYSETRSRGVSRSRYRTKRRKAWSRPQPLANEGHDGVVGGDEQGVVYLYWNEGGTPTAVTGPREYSRETGHVKAIVEGRASLPNTTEEPRHSVRIEPAPGGGVFVVGKSGGGSVTFQKVTVAGP